MNYHIIENLSKIVVLRLRVKVKGLVKTKNRECRFGTGRSRPDTRLFIKFTVRLPPTRSAGIESSV